MMIKRIGALILAGAAALSLMACGSSYASNSAATEEAPAMAAGSAYDEKASYDGGYMAESWEEAAVEEEEAEAAYDSSADSDIEEPVEPPEPAEETEIDPEASKQKLIYTCDVQMETLTFQETIDNIKAMITKYKGLVESESTSDGNYDWYYSNPSNSGTKTTYMTVRIPTKDYENFLKGLEGTGSKIRSQSQYVQNITRAYNDQTVLIEALKTQETRLLEMMEKAETIEDMIAIEERLTEVQTQLNQAKRALASMDTDVAYSTINLTINEVRDYTPNTYKESFFERVKRSITESWSGFGDFLQDAVIAIIYLIPFLILVAIIASVIILIVRRSNKKRAAQRGGAQQVPGAKKEKKLFGKKKKADPAMTPQDNSGDDPNRIG